MAIKTFGDTSTGYMVKIADLIAALKDTHDKFGNTCVYVRGSLSWGAVALNRQADDEKRDKEIKGGVALEGSPTDDF